MANAEEALRPNQVAAAAAGATELLLLFAFFHNSHISLCVHIYIYIYVYIMLILFFSHFLLFRGGVHFPPIWHFSGLLFWGLYKMPREKKELHNR